MLFDQPPRRLPHLRGSRAKMLGRHREDIISSLRREDGILLRARPGRQLCTSGLGNSPPDRGPITRNMLAPGSRDDLGYESCALRLNPINSQLQLCGICIQRFLDPFQ